MEQLENSGTRTAAAVFFEAVARRILEQHAPPDLRGAIVLLPSHHVAQPLAQALASEARQPALLLPHMLTLNDWLQSVPLTVPMVPASCRAAELYQALRARKWFADGDLWGITSELLELLDELTRHRVMLPQDEQNFLAQLERAYQAGRNAPMQFEARVVHELWYAMNAGGELDATRATQQQLAQLAQQAAAPLYVLLASDPAAPEARFLDAYAERAPVTLFDLRELAGQQAGCAVLHALSPALSRKREKEPIYSPLPLAGEGPGERGNPASLRDQAARLREHFPQGALTHLRLFAAHSLEQEAHAAELQVRRWLLAGKTSIAIVAQDRLVARRVRALLERAQVLVRDETGWTLSTLSASTVLMRWLDALQSDFYHQDLLDLLKSPFIFADQDAGERKQAVYRFEQLLRKHGVAVHLESFLELAGGDLELQVPLARLRQAAVPLQRSSATLGGWLHGLHQSLDILGVTQGLRQDAAGAQLLLALDGWQSELEHDGTRFSRAEWRHWLAQQLDANTFSDNSIDSPVLLTSLAATRWRGFDAVLLLGCDAAHLPGADNGSLWFNDAVRGALGLPTRESHLARQHDDLLGLLALNDTVLATWQASRGGEQNLLSPWLEMLRALHQLAYGDDLAERELGVLQEDAQVGVADFPLPDSAAMPAPGVPQQLLPHRISPSGYNSLVACPYQFYARHVLRLNEMDEVRESVEKRDYGEWVHGILHRFHHMFPRLNEVTPAMLEQALLSISSDVFAPAMRDDYLASAWLLRWQQAIPAYLQAQLRGEAEGWHYCGGEMPFELPLEEGLMLHGRIDRVDAQGDGVVRVPRDGRCEAAGDPSAYPLRVLDYKMVDAARLRTKLKEPGEDVQLACYAYACQAAEAAFLSIEKDQVKTVVPPQDIVQLAQDCAERLRAVFAQMRAGAALPAHGVDEACRYCEMRGLCRKAEWQTASGAEHGDG